MLSPLYIGPNVFKVLQCYSFVFWLSFCLLSHSVTQNTQYVLFIQFS